MLKYQFDWSVVLEGQYHDWLMSGLKMTIKLSTVSIILSFLVGLLIAIMRMSNFKPIRYFAIAYLEFFRNTPLLVQIFFWYFGSYKILPEKVNEWMNGNYRLEFSFLPSYINDLFNMGSFEFSAAMIGLTIYTSAFIAEDIRSGVRSIPKEQMEAARSAGFSYLGAMFYIILPQAIRITIPPIVNQFLNLAKNSSLAMTIGVMELTYQARQIESYTFKAFEAFTASTLIYLVISLTITALMHLYSVKVLMKGKA